MTFIKKWEDPIISGRPQLKEFGAVVQAVQMAKNEMDKDGAEAAQAAQGNALGALSQNGGGGFNIKDLMGKGGEGEEGAVGAGTESKTTNALSTTQGGAGLTNGALGGSSGGYQDLDPSWLDANKGSLSSWNNM